MEIRCYGMNKDSTLVFAVEKVLKLIYKDTPALDIIMDDGDWRTQLMGISDYLYENYKSSDTKICLLRVPFSGDKAFIQTQSKQSAPLIVSIPHFFHDIFRVLHKKDDTKTTEDFAEMAESLYRRNVCGLDR